MAPKYWLSTAWRHASTKRAQVHQTTSTNQQTWWTFGFPEELDMGKATAGLCKGERSDATSHPMVPKGDWNGMAV